ncbi:protein transport protein Sec16A isoform X1 [Astyanax mexicanus]|uniref:protein transport protein Sec16A isoform X1 n=1 Tax=Astyanax mexicanus TaxID=7994 RepID=UPI000440D960|nr:protein transport protein Sec16A isoform X1 [Astyanax mexicanus]XP_049322523.1 protein transport protein Sec16A isoform X1 [Astyanax mexicanus]
MQPPPRAAPPGACGPPPSSGGPNAFRRTRPHKHGAAATASATVPPAQPMSDPFAYGRQAPPLMPVGSQALPPNSSPLPVQSPPPAVFSQPGPSQVPTLATQVASAGPPPPFFTPYPGPSRPSPAPIPPPSEPGYFNSQEPMPYIAQLPNPAPPFSSNHYQPPPASSTPPVQSNPPFQPAPTAPSHLVPDHGSRPPSVQNYFQPTSDPPQPFHVPPQAQASHSAHSPHVGQPQNHPQNHIQSPPLNTSGLAGSQQQSTPFSAQNYFSQTGAFSEPWFSQVPQDPAQRACPVPYVPADSGTLSMFFQGNDVENEETLSCEGRVNGVSHLPHAGTVAEAPAQYLNDSGNIRAGAGPCESVENLECVPNQEVLPSEPLPSHVYEAGPNLETPDSAPRPARSASVSSSYSNVSHGSGHAPHSTGHPPRRHQGVVGTFIQQESPRPPDPPASHPPNAGYFEQIDSAPAAEQSPTFPTPSPPKPVGVFQPSANSSFEPVRSHGIGVRPAEVDRARMVMEKSGADGLPGNLEQPPDNMETIYFPGGQERRPSSRAHGARRPCDSPATTLWAHSDPAGLGANILLAPAAPPLATTLVPARQPSAEVIQPPEDVPLDLQPPRAHPQPHSENLENPPDSAPQASLGYASLLVTTPPVEALNQPVLIAPPSTNYNVIAPQSPSQTANQIQSPKETTSPVRPPSQTAVANQLPSSSSSNQPPSLFPKTPLSFQQPSSQSPLNLAREVKDGPPPSQSTHPPLSRAQSLRGDGQGVTSPNSQITPSAPSTNQNQPSNYELLDFSMHQPQSTNQSFGPPLSQSAPPTAMVNNTPGFYLQVTKDAQQAVRTDSEPPPQAPATNPSRPSSNQTSSDPAGLSHTHNPVSNETASQPPPVATPTSHAAPPSVSGPAPPPAYPSQPGNTAAPPDPQRPPSALGGQSGYGAAPSMPVPGYGGYYPEYQDGRHPYPPQYPNMDPRAQNYYQDDPYRRADPRYSQYNGPNPGYREAERQPERPSSRTSQYSDRPNSRQGYSENYPRPNRSAYEDYYANYYKKQYEQYADRNRWYDPNAAYDPRYRGYYDQAYNWYNYDPEAYRRADPYYGQQYATRPEGYDDPWRYYPGYDSSFDDDYRRRDPYADEFDRRSVHSERSAHSVHSSHSRQSSFSSRSQQSQVYRSQPDLVAASYDATASTLPVDYSYGQYPGPTDTQNYSQYNATDTTWTAPEQPPPRPLTPEKFSVPHCCARFGPAGQLILVQPNLPSAGQPALVELHSMETMMQDSPEQTELRAFPGPLVKEETHKVDVIKFAQNKAQECIRNDDLIDKDSAVLIWEFIVLLCRQNGTVVGTDLADLLLKEHRSVWLPGKSPNEANLIDFNNEALERPEEEESGPLSLLSDTFMGTPENAGKETERFRELLLFGRKKDALESAMKNGLWGHALLLASKMDNRTHARVMTRFANSLPINDPLQTVYQLMSGRMPAAATCCGDEKWGDWRPHLAMVLSNLTHTLDLDTRTISTMGDTLASKGLVDAAHFCYLMAQVGLGVFTKKSTKMVLIGSNHSLPFARFCTIDAIQKTEAYEYAQSLGSQPLSLPNFQVFKFIYACRLAETGLCAQAFHYCEVIARALLTLPDYHSPVFISQLIQMSERLRFFDPQLKEKPEQELFQEPDWLLLLRKLNNQIKDGVISLRTDCSTPQLSACTTPSSEEHPSLPDHSALNADPHNHLMTSLMPQPGPPTAGVQLMPPAPTTILQDGVVPLQHAPPPGESIPFYPAAPAPPQPGFVSQYQEHQEPYHPMPTQSPTQMSPNMPQQIPLYTPAEMPQHMTPGMPPSMPPGTPHGMHPQMPGADPTPTPPSPQQLPQPPPPSRGPLPQMDFYDSMAQMSSGRRSRTTSQSSTHMMSGRRSRTTSESSNHSTGRERSNSAANQSSPPPPPIPEAPSQEAPKKTKKDSPKKGGGGGILSWLYRRGKNEAHLPDDTNKSIVWDGAKQRWVNLDEPEEESKPPPPPPSMFPKAPTGGPAAGPGMGGPPGPPGAGPPVNMFSRKAGTRGRYVDVLNPGRGDSKPASVVPPPADLFAPLAPMAMPANLFVPSAAPDDQQPMEGSVPDSNADNMEQTQPNATVPQMFNPTLLPPGPEGTQSGELSRSSSMSSLSREVSQHLNQGPTQGAPPSGGVTFYNPSQFAQSAPPARSRPGRLGQREYPTLK